MESTLFNGIECKSYLRHEKGRWAVDLCLPPWLGSDLSAELDGHVLVDIGAEATEEGITITFVQMPVNQAEASCANCGAQVLIPQVPQPVLSWKTRLWRMIRK